MTTIIERIVRADGVCVIYASGATIEGLMARYDALHRRQEAIDAAIADGAHLHEEEGEGGGMVYTECDDAVCAEERCDVCGLPNDRPNDECVVVRGLMTQYEQRDRDNVPDEEKNAAGPGAAYVDVDPARCDVCGTLNDRANDECVACGHPRDDYPSRGARIEGR